MTLVARIAERFLLASGVNGLLLYLLGFAGVPLVRATFIATLVVSLGIALLRSSCKQDRVEWLPLAVLAIPFLLSAAIVTVVPLSDWDGRLTWIPKAEAIAREGSIRGPFFLGERGLNLHNRYPLLVPLNVAALGMPVARIWYALLPLAALIWCLELVRVRFGKAASWIVVAAAWLAPIVTATEGGAMSAYSDLAVMAFFAAAFLSIDDPYKVGIWLAFLVLAKNEGMMLALCAIIAAAFVYRGRSWILAIPPLLAAMLLAFWRRSIPAAYDEQYEVLLRELPARWPRAFEGAIALGRHALAIDTWGLLWVFAAVAFLVGIKRRSTPAIAATLALAGYCATFAITSWNIDELARVSADRLLSHLLVPALLSIAALFAPRPTPSP